jgi:hypothetical protein
LGSRQKNNLVIPEAAKRLSGISSERLGASSPLSTNARREIPDNPLRGFPG